MKVAVCMELEYVMKTRKIEKKYKYIFWQLHFNQLYFWFKKCPHQKLFVGSSSSGMPVVVPLYDGSGPQIVVPLIETDEDGTQIIVPLPEAGDDI